MGTKRRREQADASDAAVTAEQQPRKKHHALSEVDTELAKLYDDLADEVRATRLQAARQLVELSSRADGEKKDKILNRLIKGLCSSRKAARLGFIITLTEVFAKRCSVTKQDESPDLDIIGVPRLIETLTAIPSDSVSGQEKKDCQLGRCLAYRAFIESKAISSCPEKAALSVLELVLDSLLSLYKAVPSLRRDVGATANQVLSCDGKSKATYATALLEAYGKAGALKSPECLGAWLTIRRQLPGFSFPKDIWHIDDPFSKKDRQTLASLLRGSDVEKEGEAGVKTKQDGVATKAPHPVWSQVLSEAFQRTVDTNGDFHFGELWVDIVANSFFSAKASVERKAIGLQIFNMALQGIPAELLRHIFVPIIIRCIVNQRSSPNNNLYSAAAAALAINQRSKNETGEQWTRFCTAVSRTIIEDLAMVDFDRVTRTKLLEGLLSGLTPDCATVFALIPLERCMLRALESDNLNLDAMKRAVADMLLMVARQQAAAQIRDGVTTSDDDAARKAATGFWRQLFEYYVKYSYLSPPGETLADVPKATQEVWRSRMMSTLSCVLDPKVDPDFTYPEYVVSVMDKLVAGGGFAYALEADDRVLETLASATSTLKAIAKMVDRQKGEQRTTALAFRLLLSLTIIQVHNGEADAVTLLDDLQDSWGQWKESKAGAGALIEILLSFVSKPSTLFKKLAEQVFSAIAPTLDLDALEALFDILGKGENVGGQKELFENADEVEADLEGDSASDEDSDESADDEDASDVEVVEVNGHLEQDSDASGSDEDDSDGSSAEDDEDDSSAESDASSAAVNNEELTAFESKLAQTLQTQKLKLNGATDDEDASSDDSDMDDDQMMALDSHLTTIFKERTKQASKKVDAKAAKETVVHFKNRVLDLLAIFVKQCYTRDLAIETLVPLLLLVRTTTTKAVSEKAFTVLKTLFDTCTKHKEYPGAAKKALFSTLKLVHEEMRQSGSKIHASACSRSSLFLAKVLLGMDKKHYAKVSDMYAKLQQEWFADPKSKIPGSVFTEWTSWSLNSRK